MNAIIRWFKTSVDGKLPRFNKRRLKMPNQISTWLSHEPCFGVYTKRIRWSGHFKKAAREAIFSKMPVLPFSPNVSLCHRVPPRIPPTRPTYGCWAGRRQTPILHRDRLIPSHHLLKCFQFKTVYYLTYFKLFVLAFYDAGKRTQQ